MCNRSNSSPTVTDCIFTGNLANSGGGMYNYSSNPTVTDCTFVGNSAYDGGGMYNTYGSRPIVSNCAFSSNSAGNSGGGMYNFSSSPIVSYCTFTGNSASGDWTDGGGGMYNSDSSSMVISCTFTDNSATDDNGTGGGMSNESWWRDNSPTVTDCTFTGNSAGRGGGGMYNYMTYTIVTGCTFTGNSATRGGGMFEENCSSLVLSCTFTGNSAEYAGGGMYSYYYCYPRVISCTFTGNSADRGGGMSQVQASATVTNSILWGNTASSGRKEIDGFSTVSYCVIQGGHPVGTNIITANPLFVDAAGGDFHLQGTSPCINAGSNRAEYLPAIDFEGDRRIIYGRTDIGADEVYPIAGDYEPDEDLDLADFAMFALHWAEIGCDASNDWCGGADMNHANDVDVKDIRHFAEHWLVGTGP